MKTPPFKPGEILESAREAVDLIVRDVCLAPVSKRERELMELAWLRGANAATAHMMVERRSAL